MAELGGTALLVLAAGLSQRFGEGSKLMAPLRGKPLGLHIADTVAGAGFARKLVMCRQGDAVLQAAFAGRGFEVVVNPDSGRGQASSLALGVRALARRNPKAILVCLADMPFVTMGHLETVAGALGNDMNVVASRLPAGQPSPPAAFARVHFDALTRLEGDKGARSLLASACLIDAPAEVLADFDTPGDFANLG
ncbi:MAG: CTP:molybdopterin cytidylyltransferase [Devosia sp.]|uniref:nucleotidyltransferase family protein n=1 Tax=Devosia sp. TaxID=1871048 RepID=UPI00262EDF12|nr:nucleotidyltransferase family protein [Devosia sp.]MDB5527505.1 CTP:molybdopterin cytidylyltransferase [Devosia sp.]